MNHRQQVFPTFDLPDHLIPAGRYLWELFTDATDDQINEKVQVLPPISQEGWFPISKSFHDLLKGDIEKVAHRYKLPEGLSDFRKAEPLACCFYLINSLHETLISSEKLDRYGRYPYAESIQYANKITEINYCQMIFEEIFTDLTGKILPKQEGKIFWSHDIDYMYSAWKNDLILKWKKKKFHHIPRVLWDRILYGDRWNNIEKILKLEKCYGIRSVFFWLSVQGKVRLENGAAIDHADYHFKSEKMRNLWHKVRQTGSYNGLHKSAFSLDFEEELKNLPERVDINRNHFLAATFPRHYHQIEKAGIKWDATLGFAEHIGFRNSYGRPFRPFNLQKNRPFHFYEIPLHIMDTTLTHYMNMKQTDAIHRIRNFIHDHHFNSVIGILLHNSHLDFRSSSLIGKWEKLYEDLSDYNCFDIRDSDFQ